MALQQKQRFISSEKIPNMHLSIFEQLILGDLHVYLIYHFPIRMKN